MLVHPLCGAATWCIGIGVNYCAYCLCDSLHYCLIMRINQPTNKEISRAKKEISREIIPNLPLKSGVSPVFSLTSIPDALNIYKDASDTSSITAVDMAVARQKFCGANQCKMAAMSTEIPVRK